MSIQQPDPRGVPRSRADLRAAGISDSQLKRGHTRLVRGQWLHGAVTPKVQHFLRAALHRAPDDAFLTRDSAALVLGGIAPSSGVVHLGTTTGRRVRVSGMEVHRYTQRPEVSVVDGFPVTGKAQTFLDLAPVLGLVELVVLGDSLSLRDAGLPELLRRRAGEAGGRGVVAARRAAALVRVGAESAQETRTRLLMVLAGLPEPVLQHPMVERGRVVHRLDMALVEQFLAIEYDGDHHLSRGQRERDILRRAKWEGLGWRFIDVISPDIYRHPGAFLDRASQTMRSRGILVPERLDPQWRLHFPP